MRTIQTHKMTLFKLRLITRVAHRVKSISSHSIPRRISLPQDTRRIRSQILSSASHLPLSKMRCLKSNLMSLMSCTAITKCFWKSLTSCQLKICLSKKQIVNSLRNFKPQSHQWILRRAALKSTETINLTWFRWLSVSCMQ